MGVLEVEVLKLDKVLNEGQAAAYFLQPKKRELVNVLKIGGSVDEISTKPPENTNCR